MACGDLTPKQQYMVNCLRASLLTKALSTAALIVAANERSRDIYTLALMWDRAAVLWIVAAATSPGE